jgi:hypothetical protein
MTSLPVREMVLYKHGVGFFVRQGTIEGTHIALTFRKDEINDVLKSLAVFDRSGGQVLGIHYQTPMDKATRLASSSIRLSYAKSMLDLLKDLRGRQATLQFEVTPGTTETHSGRIIGIDEASFSETVQEIYVSLLTNDGQTRLFPFTQLRALKIDDDQAAHDLTYFLDTSLSEDDRRSVHVRLTDGTHDAVIYYVAPSPTWRVSYRFVGETDEKGTSGKALLQGWGLFDNRLEEDLNDVRVTLVAGQPISFIYELYASRIPHRPTVQDETRIAPGPIEFAGVQDSFLLDEKAYFAHEPEYERAITLNEHALGMAMPAAPPAPIARLEKAVMAQSAPVNAETKDSGEMFQYIVTTPVSVKRGESALVPIVGSEIEYERELLYNGDKFDKHPVAALRFYNKTGLTLERGPVTIVEDGDYKGEAVVAFTKENNQVYLPYAVELGIKVTERDERYTETFSMSIQNRYLMHEMFQVLSTTYIIENSTAKPQTVTIEASIPSDAGQELYETRLPDVETANERRWRVAVPAHGKTEFISNERSRTYRHEELTRLDYRNLQKYLENKWLDRALFDALSRLLEMLGLNQRLNERRAVLENERAQLYAQQENLRANLGALQATGQEAPLRNRLLKQLENSQDKLESIDGETHTIDRQIAENTTQIERMIADLNP